MAETISLVVNSGSATASMSLTFRTVAASAEPVADGTTGFEDGTNTTTVPVGASSVTYALDGTYVAGTPSYAGMRVIDTNKKITGSATLALSYVAAATVGSDGFAYIGVTSSSSIAQAMYTVMDTTAAGISGGTLSTTSSADATSVAAVATPSIVSAAPGAVVTIKALVLNNYGVAKASVVLSATVSGRNPSVAPQVVVTDANGYATFTFADTNSTSLVTSSSISITGALGTTTASILYSTTNVPATITLTSTGDTDAIAGTTKADIAAGATGALNGAATSSAVVKNAAGSLLAGVPVTFTVTGLVGAEVNSTLVTVYTNSIGVAATAISSYKAGKAVVTATAGTITATDDLYFAQGSAAADLLEARTITATVSGASVIATVSDRYGNPIKGVTVNATRTGGGTFGASSTATGPTDKNGQVEFVVTPGSSDTVVTVAFSDTTYGQSNDTAGYVGGNATTGTIVTAAVAGTTTVAQAGLGSTLALAGINSATATVVPGVNASVDAATAAADAAAEATDAANAATDAANAAAEAADAATAAAQDAADAVAALSTQVSEMVNALKKQITSLTNLVIKIQKKVKA